MNTFLSKISRLSSIQEVLFISTRGELLFLNSKNDSNKSDDNVSTWNAIIDSLNSPIEAEFFFEKGGYYLHYTDIGYVVVGMNGFSSLKNIKSACANLQAKLSDPTICIKVLLTMLDEADDTLKPQLVTALFPFANNNISEKLLVLLGKEAEFDPAIRSKLLVNIFQILGQCGSPSAQHALKKLLKEHSSSRIALENEARYAAQVALAQLDLEISPESKTAHPRKEVLSKNVQTDRAPSVNPPSPSENGYAAQVPKGQRILDLLNQSTKGEAIALVLEQIEICAGKKQFDMAEQLREWLIEIDSSSLREIIRAAEIIEEEKKASISDEQLGIWRKLVSTLSTEDYSSLYHSMIHKQYNNGEIVVQQGEYISTLFFVNSGRVQLYSANQEGEYALKVVEAGEIFGAETFFDISIWTMSAKSLGADLSLLTWDRLLKLKEGNPALQTKLMGFCSQFKLTNVAFNKASTTRRKFERIKVSGKVAVSLLTKAGDASQLGLKGTLMDISKGGLAFSLRFSKKKNAIALLQRNLKVTVRTVFSNESLQRNGVVKAVKCHDYVGNHYTIHMKFDEELSNEEVYQATSRK